MIKHKHSTKGKVPPGKVEGWTELILIIFERGERSMLLHEHGKARSANLTRSHLRQGLSCCSEGGQSFDSCKICYGTVLFADITDQKGLC